MGNLKMRPLWTLAGAYLLYLAFQQARLLFDGRTETRAQAVICIVSGLVFVAVGAWVLWREWNYARTPDTDDSADADTPEDSDNIDASNDSDNVDAPEDSGETENGA